MKSLLIYYFVSLGPFAILIMAAEIGMIDPVWFSALLLCYAFVYRNITDYYRLRSKNAIAKGDFRQMFRLGTRQRFFKELYLP